MRPPKHVLNTSSITFLYQKGVFLVKFLITFLLISSTFITYADIDTSINDLISKISGDSIWSYVNEITKYERYTKASDADESSFFLQNYLQDLNYSPVYLQDYRAGYTPNVYTVKKGKTFPNEYLLIGAHYDSYQKGADAADDNGSGVAALMEIARIFSKYEFDRSIILVFFSGEELGLLGSEFFADSAVNNNINIVSVVNLDVIGYLHPGSPFDFDCSYNSSSIDLYNNFKQLVSEYIPEISIVDASKKTFWRSSDHASFWDNNIKGLFLAGELNPYSSHFNNLWHTTNDKLGTSANSKELMEVVARSATLLTVDQAAIYEDPVEIADFTFAHEIKNQLHIIGASNNNIQINYSRSSNISLKIFNISGQCVNQISTVYVNKGINSLPLANNLVNGYYILEIGDNGIKLKQPFIVK